ncbi:Nramp family divalent metal transporter [Mariniphaga sediminis]|uniref:Nramp family divalent metal transporter n=1 Tax=Mariniphaga sediminis TaxID=1628158 RepID=UPI0035634DC2
MKNNIFSKTWKFLLSIGPGIFCIGFTIGTGSITSMTKAGSMYGMQLLWVLFLSAFFSWVLMEAYGRFALVTGDTAIYAFRKNLKFGKAIALITVVSITIGQWGALSGILGLTSNAIYEILFLFFDGGAKSKYEYWFVLGIAVVIIITMFSLLSIGRYSFFEKVLVIFVTIMGISFIITMFIVPPTFNEITKGFKFQIPEGKDGNLMATAFVGTTMAAATFIVRPLVLHGKGWGKSNLKDQSRDALSSGILIFFISMAVMICATGAIFGTGKTVTKVLDMVTTLEPLAGRFAVALFMTGALSAGLSSIFPILMVAPIMYSDYKGDKLDLKSKHFKILTVIASILGLMVPVLGANPIAAQIATQVVNVFILPLVVGSIIILINRKKLMGKHKAGLFMNMALVTAFVFSCLISYTGIISLIEMF